MSVTLTRTTQARHPTPSYRVSLDGKVIGKVTRYGVLEPKTGRWVYRGYTLRTYWAAEDAFGYTRREKARSRAEAVEVLVQASPDSPATDK